MGFRITTNVASLNSQRNLVGWQKEMQDSFAKLSSGSRINKSADDAAGLAISETLKAQVRSFRQASRNANDAVSVLQTSEGGLNEISNIIVRLRELGIQAASDTVGDKERGLIQAEVGQLKSELDRIANSTRFGSTQLLNGTSQKFDFQVGINNNPDEDRITFDSGQQNATLSALGLDSVDFTSKEGAQESLSQLDEASTIVSKNRANLGAMQNRMFSTITNLGIQDENLSAANSRIRDTDIANATAELTRNNILLQAGTSTLAQANQTTATALKLIG